jgi:hypothetical protein
MGVKAVLWPDVPYNWPSLFLFARVDSCMLEWAEINFETTEWRIPVEKVKAGVLHIIPLSLQAQKV